MPARSTASATTAVASPAAERRRKARKHRAPRSGEGTAPDIGTRRPETDCAREAKCRRLDSKRRHALDQCGVARAAKVKFYVPGRTFMTRLSRLRGIMLAGTLGTLLVVGWQAAAQQPLPPGSPLIGRPETDEAKKLAPVAPPPIPTAAEKLPLDKLKAPKGFKIELYASGVDNARTLRLGDKGTVFVSSRIKDKIHAIVEKNGKRAEKG